MSMYIGIAIVFTLLGILLQATILQNLELFEKTRKNQPIVQIIMESVGTEEFHIRTIKQVTGLKPISSLNNQTIILQSMIVNLVDKINYYGLTDFYDIKLQIQVNLANYCKNLEQLNNYIKREGFNPKDEDSIIARAAKEIEIKNSTIIRNIYSIDEMVNNTIDSRGLKLLPDPQP